MKLYQVTSTPFGAHLALEGGSTHTPFTRRVDADRLYESEKARLLKAGGNFCVTLYEVSVPDKVKKAMWMEYLRVGYFDQVIPKSIERYHHKDESLV
jgi:hypothetical protein